MVDFQEVSDFYQAKREITEEKEIHVDESCLQFLVDGEVKWALDQLPSPFRRVVIMADMEEYSYEIAEILDCPIGTVMSRLHRGRRLLQRALRECAKKLNYLSCHCSSTLGERVASCDDEMSERGEL